MATLHFDEILVPTDASETADAALDAALSLASRTGARVHLLSVVNPYVLSKVTDVGESRSEVESIVAEAAERARDAGVGVETAVAEGAPHEEVGAYVDEHGIDVVVMGTHGRSGVGRALMGSVTEKVVRTVDVPVLTIHEPIPSFEPSRMLLPTDGSDPATAAERVALSLADEYDATLEALSVVDSLQLAAASDPAAGGEGMAQVTDLLKEQAETAVQNVAADGTSAGVSVETTVGEGRPHERILAAAEEHDADVIVVGTHGRSGVQRFVLGSVAEKVLRLADRPVLVVPAANSDGTAA
ncbi:universal stress protein [Halorarum halobium]|uniref:universal stress protein n=1 Tax=Halorarum halobium TaxID=3075121 RepID=UPI0028ACA387|nr:universal stress protein [Halobaculum sp. XH14]